MKKISLLVAALAAITLASTSLKLGGAIYPRYALSDKQSTFELMGAEATIQSQVTSETRDIMYAALQVYTGGVMSGWFKGIHFGEAYAMFPLGLSLPTIKVGQAVVPFGLLETYDIHTQIVQTTYARSLGLRLDPGLGLTGVLGRTGYALWLSNGNGPDRMDNDKGKVVTARVAPRFLLGNADLTFGLSGLCGSLPYWSIDSLANFPKGPQSYAVKYRLGLDNTADWGPLTLRLEGVAGKDSALSGATVFGYYAEARYAFVSWLEALAKYDGWHANGGQLNNLSTGLNFYPPNTSAFEIQTTYQIDLSKTAAGNENNWKFITQLVVRI
ncbi:hypothetical protein FJY68_11275 [candidate division WOR-3 bacterium]|uniref:Uncharacterized protein n=1 Tax=candidate division WOR-3 bacterium TaxID=2052148 RepID=A0A937XIN4_UNCW3|nr:hypothetical protein [candidate division WOR-3 bacterium]